MIPTKVEQFLKNRNEPDFFVGENRAACAEIHESVRRCVENGTKTITLNVDAELLRQAETMLNAYGWTIEEATVPMRRCSNGMRYSCGSGEKEW